MVTGTDIFSRDYGRIHDQRMMACSDLHRVEIEGNYLVGAVKRYPSLNHAPGLQFEAGRKL